MKGQSHSNMGESQSVTKFEIHIIYMFFSGITISYLLIWHIYINNVHKLGQTIFMCFFLNWNHIQTLKIKMWIPQLKMSYK